MKNEINVSEIMKTVKSIADIEAGVEFERTTLNEFEPMPREEGQVVAYSEYTTLKAMKAHAGRVESELKQQKDELLEALKGATFVLKDEGIKDWTFYDKIITKYSNNDNT